MNAFTARLLTATAILSIPVAASAHRPWLLPSATEFGSVGSVVTVDAAISDDLFFADHQPMRLDSLKVWAPDGSEGKIDNAITGRTRSTFDVKLDQAGTWKIGTASSMVMGTVKINGEERRVGGRPGGGGPGGPDGAPAGQTMPAGTAPAGVEAAPRRLPPLSVDQIPADATDVKLTEVSTRTEIYVTVGIPSATVFAPSGKGLEFQPVSHPDELLSNEKASFKFLIDGQPAAGVKISVIPGGKRFRNDEDAREFTTGADGIVRIDWPAAGMYWINATMSDSKPTAPSATARRMTYVTTVEVLLP